MTPSESPNIIPPGDTDTLREAFRGSAALQEAVGSLGAWFGLLRTAPFDLQYPDSRLKAVFASETDNPVAWCSSSAAYLPPEVETLLGSVVGPSGEVETLQPSLRYLLGRASMRCMTDTPSGSSGLALAYGLIWPLNQDGVAAIGADDELIDRLRDTPAALSEIEQQARNLKETAIANAFTRDRERVAGFIEQAAEPRSLEACTHWTVREATPPLDFARVVQVVGLTDLPKASAVLGLIGNPALVAAVLSGSNTLNEDARLEFLRSAREVFDTEGHWTGETTAWMMLLDVEDRLTTTLQEQYGAVRLGTNQPPEPEQVVRVRLDHLVDAIFTRVDGPRLALEWLGHLVWAVVLSKGPRNASGESDSSAFEPKRILLEAAGSRLTTREWAHPLRMWRLFEGSSLVRGADDTHTPVRDVPFHLPVWRDWLGQANGFVPVAVAVHLWNDNTSLPEWLIQWVRLVCRELEEDPTIHQLADMGSSTALSYLAWPLVRSDRPSARFGELWSDANWQLTRARFSPLETAARTGRPCVALIRVGLRMLEYGKLYQSEDMPALASALADAIDQVRYTLPEIGVAEWSTLVGTLAGAMASLGLLGAGGCETLLARYRGDDGSLAAAAVNAVANGVPNHEVRQALASLGENAAGLVDRWERWNERLGRDKKGIPGNFLAHLVAIAGP